MQERKGRCFMQVLAQKKTTEEGANKEGKLPEKESTAVCSNTPLLQRKIPQLGKQPRPFDTAGSKNQLLLLEN